MQRRPTLIALLGLWACTVQAHERPAHAKPAGTSAREQQDWGIAASPGVGRRTVVVRMSDRMRFAPELIQVKLGETLRFDIRNDGRMLHEMVIGTAPTLEAHAALMLKFPGMEHDEPYMAHVAPGQRGRIDWTFNRAGDFEFACLIAGHYQAGMKGRILVRS
jgi:uncharacterized cupredoxin-like copper-binding protein